MQLEKEGQPTKIRFGCYVETDRDTGSNELSVEYVVLVDDTGKEQECYPFDEDDEIEEPAQKHFLDMLNSKGVLILLVPASATMSSSFAPSFISMF